MLRVTCLLFVSFYSSLLCAGPVTIPDYSSTKSTTTKVVTVSETKPTPTVNMRCNAIIKQFFDFSQGRDRDTARDYKNLDLIKEYSKPIKEEVVVQQSYKWDNDFEIVVQEGKPVAMFGPQPDVLKDYMNPKKIPTIEETSNVFEANPIFSGTTRITTYLWRCDDTNSNAKVVIYKTSDQSTTADYSGSYCAQPASCQFFSFHLD